MASELMNDIEQLDGFLRQQRNILPEAAWADTRKQHVSSLRIRIMGMPTLSASHATSLSGKIANMPITEDDKQVLSQCLNDSLLRSQTSPKPSATCKTVMQNVPEFGAFLSERDTQVMINVDLHSQEKLGKIADRCLAIGLYYPAEKAVGRITATCCAAGLEAESHEIFLAHVQKFKEVLKKKRDKIANKVVEYKTLPRFPRNLDNFEAAYKDDPPVGTPITETEVERVLNGVCALRNSHKSIRGSPPKNEMALALPSSSSSSAGNPMQHMLAFMHQCVQMQNSGNSALTNLQFNLPRPKKNQKAIEDGNPGVDARQNDTTVPDAGTKAIMDASHHEAAAGKTAMHAPSDQRAEQAASERPREDVLTVPMVSIAEQAKWLEKDPGSTEPKAKAKTKAKAKAEAKAKAKAEAKAKAKSKPEATSKPAAIAKTTASATSAGKTVVKRPAAAGWQIQDRIRPTGQKDRYYLRPDGKAFRMLSEAREAGYPD